MQPQRNNFGCLMRSRVSWRRTPTLSRLSGSLLSSGLRRTLENPHLEISSMKKIPPPLLVILTVAAFSWAGLSVSASAEEKDQAALAHAMQPAKATLEAGLKASEREGKPISAKFEIEDGKLQLSVYTRKGDGFTEAVLDPASGAIVKAEKITEPDDLKEAQAQSAAMTKAKQSLLAATEAAVKANAGYRAVSVEPELKDGHPVAEVTLLQGSTFKKVNSRLD